MNSTKILRIIAMVALCASSSACSTSVRHTGSTSAVSEGTHAGPPPDAPAHGYLHEHDNVVLVFDEVVDVYIVKNHVNYYYHKDRFYRWTNNGWETSKSFDGRWKSVATSKLPRGLRPSNHASHE